MCHLVDLPMRRFEASYELVVEDLDIRNGEPEEGAAPIPEFIEDQNPMADISVDLVDSRFSQDLEWIWPAREERWAEIEISKGTATLMKRTNSYFDKAVLQWARNDRLSPKYTDNFLRSLLHHLPKKMDFDSWVGKGLIEHVARKHGLPLDRVRASEDSRKLTYHVGNYWPHKGAKVLKVIEADLDAISIFLFDLTLELSIWLPYEMQMITSLEDELLVDQYRRGFAPPLPPLFRPYGENGEIDLFNLCQMHTRLVLGYEWFELPFVVTRHNIHW